MRVAFAGSGQYGTTFTGGYAVASKSEAKLFGGVQKHSSTTKSQVKRLVAQARVAQATYECFPQEQVDAIVKEIGKYVYDNAEMLARMAVDKSGIGVYEDKILKIRVRLAPSGIISRTRSHAGSSVRSRNSISCWLQSRWAWWEL